jgi:subtilisin-like proprotein convertase family protein
VPLTVSGMGIIGALNFSLDGTACTSAAGATTVGLDHTWVGDLAVNLTSPAGTTVTLMNRPGGTGNSGNNFCQTVLDDSAANAIQSIASGGAPWTGSFQPSSPLSTFDGENGDGTWVLNVSDNAFFDVGSVRAFTLKLAGFECGP